ncbi:MAG: uroporphyrinogen decarboxylase [Bifidobacterium sp.]|jgi:uroporphyrinogen decarboxylase|nr:uroporphyrinogen decarboxylase [Bifidobacterium sp.]MCH4175799.1 uroporphyrinogen decarboxylase [Bifidobacterium sp.]
MTADRRQIFHDIARRDSNVTTPYLVGGWQHLVGHEYGAQEFAQAYIDFVKHWDWEWVKINPRAVYYAEAWGAVFDPEDYQGFVLPRKVSSPIAVPSDIKTIQELDPLTNPSFKEALEAATLIRRGLEDRAVLQTVFSPLSVLLQIADLPLYPADTYAHSATTVQELILNQPQAAKQALQHIADTLASYVEALVKPESEGGAGLDGIFFAITGTVSEDYFDQNQYREFSEPYDQIVIDALRKASPDAVVLFHTCQAHSHASWFDDKSIELLQWDPFLDDNLAVDQLQESVPVVGASAQDFAVDAGSEGVTTELDNTIKALVGTPFLLAPSCTVPTPASDASLQVLSDSRVLVSA